MAKTPQAIDPAQAAIDAVEEALKLDFGDLDLDAGTGAAPADLKSDVTLQPATKSRTSARDNATLANAAKRSPANDDRRAIGSIVYGMNRRPSAAPFWWATIVSALWLVGAGLLGARFFAADITTNAQLLALLNQPSAVSFLVASIVPILFFFGMAFLMWRAQEMRLAANSMSEVALRLAEPEDIATESIVKVGQAVRREVAAMGDGVERVLARAGELEVLVHNEMMSLERSYSDNELRIRGLIEELSSQREAILNNAERIGTSLSTAKNDLSEEILSIGSKVTSDLEGVSKNVRSMGDSITNAISEQAESIAREIDSAGESLVAALSGQGESLIGRLTATGRSTVDELADVGEKVTGDLTTISQTITLSLSSQGTDVASKLAEVGNAVRDALTERSQTITATLAATGSEITSNLSNQSAAFAEEMQTTGNSITATIARQSGEITEQMRTSTNALMVDFSLRSSDITDRFDDIGARLADLISQRGDTLTADLNKVTGRIEGLVVNSGNALVERIGATGDDIAKLIENRTIGLIDSISETTIRVNDTFSANQNVMGEKIAYVGEQVAKALSMRGENLNQQLAATGLELIQNIEDKSASLRADIDSRLIQIDSIVGEKGQVLTKTLGERVGQMDDVFTKRLSEIDGALESRLDEVSGSISNRLSAVTDTFASRATSLSDELQGHLDQASESFRIKSQEISTDISERVKTIDEALDKRGRQISDTLIERTRELANTFSVGQNELTTALTERVSTVGETLETQTRELTGTLDRSLANAVRTLESQAKHVTDTLSERVEAVNISLAGNIGELATNIDAVVGTLETNASRIHELVEVRLVGASNNLVANAESAHTRIAALSEESSHNFSRAADEAASLFASKSYEAGQRLIGALSSLSTGIRAQANDTASDIEKSAIRLQDTLKSSTSLSEQTLIRHATDVEDMLRERTQALSALLNNDGANLINAMDEKGSALNDVITRTSSSFITAIDEKSAAIASNVARTSAAVVNALQAQSGNVVEALQAESGRVIAELKSQIGDVNQVLARIGDSNETLRNVLANADKNLATIETGLTNRSLEIRNAVAQAAGQSDAANRQLAEEIGKLREISELTIRDTGALASRFEGQSRALEDAASMLISAGNNLDGTIEDRQRVIEILSQGLVSKSSDIEALMRSFAGLMNDTIKQSEERARLVSANLSSSADQAAKEISNQLEKLRNGANIQMNAAITEATERFTAASEEMRRVANTIQADLQATRAEIKRGVFDLPEETRESTAAMRRLVSEQVRALNDLSEIVNAQRDQRGPVSIRSTNVVEQPKRAQPQHAYAVAEAARPLAMSETVAQDTYRPSPVTREQEATSPLSKALFDMTLSDTQLQPSRAPTGAPAQYPARSYDDEQPAFTRRSEPQVEREAYTAAPIQAPFRAPVQSPVQTQAPIARAPAEPAPSSSLEGGWVKDLLRRASTEGEPARPRSPAPQPAEPVIRQTASSRRSPQHIVESLYSLSVDIARVIDRDATIELWERYQRGERNVFTRRMRTLESPRLRDEIRRNVASIPDFAETVGRYIAEFEGLILEVSRGADGDRQSEAYLNSDVGRLYTILAQATGRFD